MPASAIQYSIRLTPELAAALERAAKRRGIKATAFIRGLILEATA